MNALGSVLWKMSAVGASSVSSAVSALALLARILMASAYGVLASQTLARAVEERRSYL